MSSISRTLSAGGGVNPRTLAVSGSSPITGNRSAGDPWVNPFISAHVPTLWNALLVEFGRTAEYWPQNNSAAAVTIELIWREGVEDEEVSPGRYSHVLIRNSDIPPSGPVLGDALREDDVEYDVVRVDAFIYGYSNVVLQDRTEVL